MGMGTALLGSAAIGGISSIFGANKAAKAQKQAAQLQAQQYKDTKNLLLPYTAGSKEALDTYGTALGLKGKDAQAKYYQDFQADPGFQTSLDNALDATMKRYSIVGRTGGGLANALLKTGQGALNQAYNTRLSQLGGLVDSGRSAASAVAGFGQSAAANQGSLLAQAGQTQGAGYVNAGNALIGGLTNYAQNQLMNQYLLRGTGGANGNPF